jgi:hypothetical protein
MIDRRSYNRLLDDFDDPAYIAQQVMNAMTPAEKEAAFGIGKDHPAGVTPAAEKMPLHWRKNPGYDAAGNLVCAGCGQAMAMGQSQDGKTHASCARKGCELYGRDYISASENDNPHRHAAVRFDPESGKYVCGCGVML